MILKDRVVLISGAAGELGTAAAHRFAVEGAKLVLVDNRPDRLAEACDDLRKEYDALLIGNADVINARSVGKLIEMVLRERERLDVLINIVGGHRSGSPLWETNLDTFDFMMALNAKSVFLMAGAAAPHMIEQGYGKIVNIGASAGLRGKKGNSAYAASKSAVIRLTESLSAEIKEHGVNVNCVLPSVIDTPMNREAMPDADYEKWVKPEELAEVLLFLSSDASRAIHGAAIPVYGRVSA